MYWGTFDALTRILNSIFQLRFCVILAHFILACLVHISHKNTFLKDQKCNSYCKIFSFLLFLAGTFIVFHLMIHSSFYRPPSAKLDLQYLTIQRNVEQQSVPILQPKPPTNLSFSPHLPSWIFIGRTVGFNMQTFRFFPKKEKKKEIKKQ